MKRNFNNKLTGIKKAEQDRRTKLVMMYLLMQEYPNEAREKVQKSSGEAGRLKDKTYTNL
jgi:hypothetical protein